MPLVDVANARLVPFTGSDGWLVRVPHAVAFVSGTAETEVRALLGACEGASSSAEVLGRVVGRLSGGSAQVWPPFGLVTSAEDGVVVLVHGRAAVEVSDEDGAPVRLSAEVDGHWLTRTVPGAARVTFGSLPRGATSEGLTDLRGGLLPARGAMLIGVGPAAPESQPPVAGVPAQQPASAGVPAAGVAAGSTGGTVPGEPSEAVLSQVPEASPAAQEAASMAPEEPSASSALAGSQAEGGEADGGMAAAQAPASEETAFGGATQAVGAGEDMPTDQAPLGQVAPVGAGEHVRVTGRYCGRGHFNAPRDHWCRICGLALSTDPADEVEGDRPPLGQLIWDNGEGDLITTDTVVGRDPGSDPSVKAGHAVGLSPSGQSEGMSRVHAELRLVGWEVLLSDRGSTNGTFIWDEGQQAWQRLEAGERQPLNIGSIVAFGERTATLESPMPAET